MYAIGGMPQDRTHSLVLPANTEKCSLLLQSEALRSHGVIRKEPQQNATPNQGNETADKEDGLVNREAVDLSDRVGEDSAKLQTGVSDAQAHLGGDSRQIPIHCSSRSNRP